MRTFPILLLWVAGAAAVCDLNLQSPYPIVVKSFGSKTAIVKRTLSSIKLTLNETVTFHCPTGISIRSDSYNNQGTKINAATANLTCGEDGIYLDTRQIVQQRSSVYISCNDAFSKALYESSVSLPGCAGNAITLLVGYKLQSFPDVKYMGMCFDLSESRLLFASFLAYTPQNLLLETQPKHELSTLKLDNFIGSLTQYFNFPTNSEVTQLLEPQSQPHLGELFNGKLFEYGSLLQDTQQLKDLSEYGSMLSIVWLRALRQGNWKNWLSALRAATNDKAQRFDVRVGVSGMATLPGQQSCNTTRAVQLKNSEGLTLPVPAYVWAHVRSLQPVGNAADEFVIVAHNSPYVGVLELSTFCVDMCAEIPWLRNTLFSQLHLMPQYGVVHCCPLNKVNKLTDFPLGNLPVTSASSNTLQTTTAEPVTAKYFGLPDLMQP